MVKGNGSQCFSPATFGTMLREDVTELCHVVDTLHRPHVELPMHRHELPAFVVVLEGTFSELTQTQRFALTAGALLFKPAGECHSNSYGPNGARVVLIECRPTTDFWGEVRLPSSATAVHDGATTSFALSFLAEIHSMASWHRHLDEFAIEISACLAESNRTNRIAHETGFFDRAHFTRVFKQRTGMTPRAYRMRSRPR